MEKKPNAEADEELARQTQAGSVEAFEQLVWRYERRIHAFAFQICGNQADAADATQETFVKAFRGVDQYDPRRDFAAWLFTIARRSCIDRHRSTTRAVNEVVDEPLDEVDPAELAARQEEGRHLWQLARQALEENQFQALWFFYAEDMAVARIAQVMGKTQVHIKVLLFRARHVLGRRLKSDRSPEPAMAPLAIRPATVALSNPLQKFVPTK